MLPPLKILSTELMYKMSPGSFLAILDLIKDHEVFSSTDRGRPQAPAAHQLMVLLKYLGTEGSGCSNPDLQMKLNGVKLLSESKKISISPTVLV
jgi:hypothetical protein